MFILGKSKARITTDKEYAEIKRLAKKFDVNIEGVSFYISKQFGWNKVLGCFSIVYRNSIFFGDDNCVENYFSTIAHELKYREQYKRYRFFIYSIMAFPLWRKWTIEKEAYAEEDRIMLG